MIRPTVARRAGALVLLASLAIAPAAAAEDREAARAELLDRIVEGHALSGDQRDALAAVLRGSPVIGQGNPAITRHPMTPAECREKLDSRGVRWERPEWEEICGGPYMAPLHDPTRERPEQARACIDVLEFPDLPCAYPLVWVRASEAAAACEAVGKRLCDAHEWEGACAGRLEEPDYRFELAAGAASSSEAVQRMRAAHNRAHQADRSWSYGPERRAGVCAMASQKSEGCDGGNFARCGSNTYPAGAFPECTSPLGVTDLNGNAAEHMNLPLAPDQMASAGSSKLGVTEMKGSWFIWDHYAAHDDWCRWRAPFWHGTRVRDAASHHNYHLGFRCCRSLDPASAPALSPERATAPDGATPPRR